MKELRDIIKAFDALSSQGDQAVLASVIRTSGSTYRHVGARALILSDDSIVGVVSGGCLESDLIRQAREVRANCQSRLIRYDHTENEDIVWGLGLGCAGVVDILLEIVDRDKPGPLTLIADVITTRAPAVMATVVAEGSSTAQLGARWIKTSEGQQSATPGWGFPPSLNNRLLSALADKPSTIIKESGAEILLETINPLVRLLIFGAGADAVPLVAIGAEIGWHTEVFDKRRAYASKERFPRADRVVVCSSDNAPETVLTDNHTVAVVMTHNYMEDLELLKFLLPLPVSYIGVLGPQRRLKLLLGDLEKEGTKISEVDNHRLYGPAGLDIGADSAEEIALSIAGEIQAVLRARGGGLLRDRLAPIHINLD